ncbi:hypothetical protein OUZ56_028058 [Daphnia magna]|uniref:Uncharacterized protein n=1 Tax=Daphnia magna TaxID=35525 RepID=A0ABR0B2R5_9CRUS|nr:hypothetical protein OUZ56_028058 [Daphnia magna]
MQFTRSRNARCYALPTLLHPRAIQRHQKKIAPNMSRCITMCTVFKIRFHTTMKSKTGLGVG